MPKMHSFWTLPKGECPEMEKLIEARTLIWGTVPLRTERHEVEELDLRFLTEDYSRFNERSAVRVNHRIMWESFQCFSHVKTLCKGYLPFWGLPLRDYAIIPAPHLMDFMQVLSLLPPYASWQRLYNLCQHSIETGQHMLYRGIVEAIG